MLEIIPLQLLAYYIAVRRGCDVESAAEPGEIGDRGIGRAAGTLEII